MVKSVFLHKRAVVLAVSVALLTLGTACGTATSQVADSTAEPQVVDSTAEPQVGDVTVRSCTRTESLTEGPYYTPNTPLRANLREPDEDTLLIVLTGKVYDTDCQPLQGVKIDFWHTDENGDYDNSGYRYRGHQLTDADGSYRLESILPVEYGDGGTIRTSHIHVKLFGADGDEALTTQLFVEGNHDPNDNIYHPSLVTDGQQVVDGVITTKYDFYIQS